MKNIAIATLIVLGAFVAISQLQVEPENSNFGQYKAYLKMFGKQIPNDVEMLYRSKIFEKSIEEMMIHNANDKNTWKMGINQFSDITVSEFINTYLGEKNSPMVREFKEEPVNLGFAGDVDWREKNIITPVKNQGACGSCWAFAATAVHESYHIQHRNHSTNIALSEQQLVDCSNISPYGNEGCGGGYAVRGLEYIKDFGQTVNSSYPYAAVNQNCRVASGNYRIFGVAEIAGCSEIEQVIQRNPLAVRVDASNWKTYAGGVFNTCETNINHAVFMVGSSASSWIIKNSWTAQWGEKGYIRLAKGDTCAVCRGPSFAF